MEKYLSSNKMKAPNSSVVYRYLISWLTKKTFVDTVSILLIILFAYTGTSKLVNYEKFRNEIGKSPLLTSFSDTVAWALPVGEILLSLLLAIPKFRLLGLYASFSLMVVFTSYLIAILQFSFFVPCTCGGVIQSMSWNTHIIFNCIFIALSAISIFLHQKVTNKEIVATMPF